MRKSTVARIVLAVAILLSTNMAVSTTGHWSDGSTPAPDGPTPFPDDCPYFGCVPPPAGTEVTVDLKKLAVR